MNTIAEIKDDWLETLSSSSQKNVFLTPQFQQVWWQNFGDGERCILRIENEEEELLGVAPFYFKNSTLSFLGDTAVSDYLDFVILNGREEEFYTALIEKLKELSFDWKSLSFISIPEKSPALSLFPELAKKQNWSVEKRQQDICPVITLPKTWEEYLQSLSKKQRHEIKRKWRNLEEKVAPEFSVVTNAENIEKDVNDFIHLHKLSGERKAEFWNEKQEKYFGELITVAAENNWLKLFFLEVESERVATMLCFDYDNQFYLYNSGYDPNKFSHLSVGNVLTSYTIKHAIELGRTRYDFLRGDEEYKFRYGAMPEPIFDLKITR